MIGRGLGLLALGLLASCTALQPADPNTVLKIKEICTASGFFKEINGIVALAYPPVQLPVAIFNRGIDVVCTDPERFASDISTVQWLLKNMPWQQTL